MADLPESDRVSLLQALAVTAELTNTDLSEAAARAMADDLSAYPVDQIRAALVRCRRELRGRLTIAAVIERLNDGRPTPNEAWAMIPTDEAGSVVLTEEMQQAFGVASPLLRAGHFIPARLAFIEVYTARVAEARAQQRPPKWEASFGHAPEGRAAALEEAVRTGRITAKRAGELMPPQGPACALIGGPITEMPAHVREQLRHLSLKVIRGGRK